MRVLIAPDCFGGTLTAPEAAEAIAAGWRSGAPDDELTLCPLADGGPGFVDVLHAALGGQLRYRSVAGPLGASVDAVWLEHDGTAYIECAQACGLHLIPAGDRDALAANTVGVGELVVHALESGVHTIVVGLGGSASTDGGAGMFRALGAVPVDEHDEPLPPGGPALATVHPEAVALYRRRPEGSPRNCWRGRVAEVTPVGARLRVTVRGSSGPDPGPDPGPDIVAEVTPAAGAELGLAEGIPVWVAIKATEVDLAIL